MTPTIKWTRNNIRCVRFQTICTFIAWPAWAYSKGWWQTKKGGGLLSSHCSFSANGGIFTFSCKAQIAFQFFTSAGVILVSEVTLRFWTKLKTEDRGLLAGECCCYGNCFRCIPLSNTWWLGFSFCQLFYVQVWIIAWHWGIWEILLLIFEEEYRAGQASWVASVSALSLLLGPADWLIRQRLNFERLLRVRTGCWRCHWTL